MKLPEPNEALKGSAFDVYGQVDPSARDWLQRLQLPVDTPDLGAVGERLAALQAAKTITVGGR